MKWSTACPDWRRRIVARESLIPFAPLYPESAEQALRVFKELVVVDVPGSPTMGECSRAWIFDFVGALFGSYDPESGRRLIKESLLLISKKNTKSTTAAGIMLTALVLNWRQSAEFLIIAPTVEIANNSYYPARDMCRADEELDALFHVQDHVRTITHRTTGASLKVIAADSSTVSGKKGTITLVDELWLFGKMANASDMLREATGGLASRPEGMTIYLSTQSNEAPAGVFKSKLDYARDVRDGLIDDPQFLPVLYEYPEELIKSKAYLDPEQFYITNPNLGASVDVQFIEREFKKAKNSTDPADLPGFLAKHLNIEIGLNLRADRWAGADFWEQQGTGGLTLESLIERCDVIEIGIDGGGLDDLLGVSAVGRDEKTGQWLAWCKAWAHPTVLERRKSEAARFKDFANSGDLVIVGRVGQDVEQVVEAVGRIYESGLLDKIGVDTHGIGAILDALIALGIEEEKIVGISQGWKMNGAIKTAERKLAEGALWHQGSAMMAWCVGNAKVEPKGNAVAITKQAAGFAKIDPLMAMFNAITLLSLNPQSAGRSWWDRVETA